jgi:hypothetical protein
MQRQGGRIVRKVGLAALLVLLLPLLIVCVFAFLALYLLHRVALYILIWFWWLPRSKDVLFVYSDSPIWHEYMTAQILPLVQDRAIVLNWSERRKWPRWSLAAHVFHSFGGDYEFNPLIILFRPFRLARIFRFWRAFREWKDGRPDPIERLRQELLQAL